MSDELSPRVDCRTGSAAEATEITERSTGGRLAVVEDNVRGIKITILEEDITAITTNRRREVVLIGVAMFDRIGNSLDRSRDQILHESGQFSGDITGNQVRRT